MIFIVLICAVLSFIAAPVFPAMTTEDALPPKKERVIGSAWQQAFMHVYIPTASGKENLTDGDTTASLSQHAPQQTPPPAPVEQKPEAIAYRPPTNMPEPSPEEMQAFLTNLEAVFNSLEDDEDLFFYSDDEFETEPHFPSFQ